MASIERTAYPKLSKSPSTYELEELFTVSPEELEYLLSCTQNESVLLAMSVLLKTFKRLGYFPNLKDVPESIIGHIRFSLNLLPYIMPEISKTTLYRLHDEIRTYLKIEPFDGYVIKELEEMLAELATIRDNPVDLINISIKYLSENNYELPAYRTINDLAVNIRTRINNQLFSQVSSKLTQENVNFLNGLLELKADKQRSGFNDIKQPPKSATLTNLKEWLEHLRWLESLMVIEPLLDGISIQKILCFADEARVLDSAELKRFSENKRYTLILCLIYHATIKARDSLIEMFLKRIHSIHNNAREKMEQIQLQNRELNEKLIDAFSNVLSVLQETPDEDAVVTKEIKDVIEEYGGLNELIDKCNLVNAYKNNNYLPLLWQCFISNRNTFFKLVEALIFHSTTEDQSLIKAFEYLLLNKHKRGNYLPADVDLNFASDRWKKLVIQRHKGQIVFSRRDFEICVFSYLADELRAGDICIEGSESFSDYRIQLSTWEECEAALDEYCNKIQIPNTEIGLVETLYSILKTTSETVDNSFPDNEELTFDEKGLPKLKRIKKQKITPADEQMAQLIYSRMPERHILDILCNCQHWANFTRHFGPLSGSDPKLQDSKSDYVYTTFSYGCNLGPVQASKHARQPISAHTLSYINTKHVTADKLNYANADIINEYCKFVLPKLWGDGTRVAADGTKIDIYEQNLLAEYHIRYGGYGGIAYHHVADNYVILFSHFIPCGVWEAVYIIEGLMKNKSNLDPQILHGDTQSQSTPVFGLSYLLGIQLLPRIRNWKDLKLYRPSPESKYEHIDQLFGDPIDWNLIKTHWKDMMQVAISIKQGKISSAMILRKLGNYSKKNRLYKAFRELGRVIRTIFLLKYISDPNLRKIINVTTNKVESYNGFSELLRFGGFGIIQTNDPIEQEKRVKYNDLVANSVMLHNVFDITNVVNELTNEGFNITQECLSILSPYTTHSIKRFGEYNIDLSIKPPPLHEKLELNEKIIQTR